MALSPTVNLLPLPAPIQRALGRLANHVRAVEALRGLGILGVAGSLVASIGMVADFAWTIPDAGRWGIWLAWVTVTLFLFVKMILGPLIRRMSLLDLAALAERTESKLGEHLTGAVGLVETPHGSRILIEATAAEAATRVGTISPRHSVPRRRAYVWLIPGLGSMALILAPSLLQPDPFRKIAQRFFMPWSNLDRISRFVIEVPPDRLVAIGSDLDVRAMVRDRFDLGGISNFNPTKTVPQTAILEWIDSRDKHQRVNMFTESTTPASSRQFTSVLPDVTASLSYRVRSGSAISREVHVNAEPAPILTALNVNVTAPTYIKQSDIALNNPTKLEVWEGSSLRFTIETSTRLKRAQITWPDQDEPTPKPLEMTTGSSPTIMVVANQTGDFRFELVDVRDLKSRPEPARRVLVRKDAPPMVTLAKVEDLKEARSDDVIIASIRARDDLEVSAAELHWAIVREGSTDTDLNERGKLPLPLSGLGTPSAQGDATFDLAKLQLKPGDIVTYRVRVVDSRPSPQEAWSEIRSLTISAKAEPLLARRDKARRATIQAKLDELKRDAATNRQETEQLRYAADAAMRGSGLWDQKRQRSLTDREMQARSVVDRLNMLAHELDSDANFAALARPTRQLADLEAEAGRAQLEKARKAEDDPKRLADLRTADARLAAVQARLDDLQRQFDGLARSDADRDKLRLLAARQETLAERAQNLDAQDQAARDQLRNDQEAMRRELDGLLKQSPELRAEVVASQAKEAKELAKRARALAERQREQARTATDLEPQKATLKILAEAQRQIENDARMLALDVDPTLTDSGKARLNVDALKRVVEPLERAEIESARQRIEEAETNLRLLNRDLEDTPSDPKALARRLAKREDDLVRLISEARRDAAQDTREELKNRLKPLAARQEAIANLTSQLVAPDAQRADAENASKSTARATEAIRDGDPQNIEPRANEARQALHHLANSLPDASRREQENRMLASRIRQATEEAGREVERHLRETGPQQGKPIDVPKAAAELAKKLDQADRKQKEALEAIAKLEVDPRAEPQRNRVKERIEALADAIAQVRQQAEPLSNSSEFTPLTGWRTVGPLPIDVAPPFDLNKAIDLKAPLLNKAGKAAVWRDPPIDAQGIVDLGSIYSQVNDLCAFASTEIMAPVAGPTRLAVGSDDTLAIWINGKQVYKYDGSRSHSLKQDQVQVDLVNGLNRVVVQCGNRNGEWKYSVAMSALTPAKFDRAASLAIRERLPQLELEARAAAERLEQKLNGQVPADEMARELAEEQKALAQSKPDEPGHREEQQRIAAAIRALNPPDALKERNEAVRQAERAANEPGSTEAAKDAAEAAEKLAAKIDHQSKLSQPSQIKSPIDPELAIGEPHLAQARDLVKRQRQVRERLQAIVGEKIAPQEQLQTESAKLGKELADLRDRSRESSPRSQGPANSAAHLLTEEAPKAMQQGSEGLAQARPNQARDAQRRAAELAERGAQATEDLASSLRTDQPAEGQANTGKSELAEARDAMQKAGQNLESSANQDAAEGAMRQAAQGLRSAASSGKGQGKAPNNTPQTAGQDTPGEGSPDGKAVDPKGGTAGVSAPDLAQLQEAIRNKTGRAWGELPGNLRAELLKQSQSKYRDDYARLIQLYYREIAADAAKP